MVILPAINDPMHTSLIVIGISGIDRDGGLYDFDLEEVFCTQTIIRNSRRVFLLAEHSKFGRPALVKVVNLRDIKTLYTDTPPPERIAAIMQEANVAL